MPKTRHTIRVVSDRLTQPVGRFMRPCVSVDDATSIAIAIQKMREAGQDVMPVTKNDQVYGVLTESSILKYVGDGASPTSEVGAFIQSAVTISNRATGAEALRSMEGTHNLLVVDDHQHLCGLISPSCFVGIPPEKIFPAMVGGMATPFGVYLTSGSVNGGKGGWFLVATGFFLITIFIITGLIATELDLHGMHWLSLPLVPETISFGALALVFRLHPIAGYHAAEHQVVHAIERHEELTPEVVGRMPRVHPRCGTNLAVAVTMITMISQVKWIPDDGSRLAIAVIFTLFFWRQVGSFVQYWITTKKPTPKQLASGIAAGRELISNYEIAPNRSSTAWQRLLQSGILHVMLGSLLASGIWSLVGWLLGIPVF